MSINETKMVTLRLIVDALMDGLRVTNRVHNEKCSKALLGLGKSTIPWLVEAEQSCTGRAHRKRLLGAIEQIRQGNQDGGNPATAVSEALMATYRLADEQLCSKATKALSQIDPEITNDLIREALLDLKNVGRCLRLLEAIEQIDHRPWAERYYDLHTIFTLSKNQAIRDQAIKLIRMLGPYREMFGFPTRPVSTAAGEPAPV